MWCIAVSPRGSECWANETAGWQEITAPESSPAGDINEKSHYLFLLFYLTVKSNMSLFVSNVWERCLSESLWRKIPEIILQAAFFQQCVSQSWIRGAGSSWPSRLSAFPTWVPVNPNTAMNSGSLWAESNTLPQSQNKQDILWTVADQTLQKHWGLARSWCLQKWHDFPVPDCLFCSLLMKMDVIREAVPDEQLGI